MSQAAVVPDQQLLIKLRKAMKLQQQAVAMRSGINQTKLSEWETGLRQLTEEEVAAISRVIYQQLKWYQNPAELRRRREDLGLSRQRVAKHVGKSEEWLAQVEAGEILLNERLITPVWEYIATTELQQGKEAQLRAALSAPVLMTPVEPPLNTRNKARLGTLKKKVGVQAEKIHLLEKSLKISQEMYRNSEESRTILSYMIENVQPKLIALEKFVASMAPGNERDHLGKLLREVQDVINE